MASFPDLRGKHPFHMHDMIRRQPEFIRETLDRVRAWRGGRIQTTPRHLMVTGCGTSYHAAMYGARILQAVAGGRDLVEATPAYDLAYGLLPRKATLIFGVSHSGSTSTTNRALVRAKRAGFPTVGMCGVRGSRMEEIVDDILVIGSARDRSWANTMSYTTQLSAFASLAAHGPGAEPIRRGLRLLPSTVRRALRTEGNVRRLAGRVARRRHVTFLAAGLDEVTTLEAALKIRETCGLSASGYHIEQFLHGPFLGLDRADSLVVLLAKEGRTRAWDIVRGLGKTGAALATLGEDPQASIRLPRTHPLLRPILSIVPMQFLAYYAALARHENPDIMRSDTPRFRAGVERLFR
jgi:glucosamine--fructose-6-phosphate aminotransferase (isomerizing)